MQEVDCFPEHLVMQSLGSFDGDYAKPAYEKIMAMPGNQVAQVHRYLDLGAKWEVCHAPMDVICSSAIRDLQSYHSSKPVILAETGAVEPNHAGPSKYYPKDTAGILLHDILFAPFFAGSAAPGMSWHWESYVHRNNLWFHYGRFTEAIKGIDPVRESLTPTFKESDSLRFYILNGKNTTLVWIRDKNSNWKTELENNLPPALIRDAVFADEKNKKRKQKTVDVYDPWANKHTSINTLSKGVRLPPFKRSVVVRISY